MRFLGSQPLTHSLKASRRIGGSGSFSSGISWTSFCAHSTNSLWEGFTLPILAWSITSEVLIDSFLAFVVSSTNPFSLHSRTVLGMISFKDFPSDSRPVDSSMVFMDEDRVSVSLCMSLNKKILKNVKTPSGDCEQI